MDKNFFNEIFDKMLDEYEKYKNDAFTSGERKHARQIQNLIKNAKRQQNMIYDVVADFFDRWNEIWYYEAKAISVKYARYLGHTKNKYFQGLLYALLITTFKLSGKKVYES